MQSEQFTTRPTEPIEALPPIAAMEIPGHLAELAEVYLGLILRSAPAVLDSTAARAEGFVLGLQAAQAITQPQYEQLQALYIAALRHARARRE